MHGFLLEQLRQPERSEILLRERYHAILRTADQEEPPPQQSPRGKPKCTLGRNLLRRLQQHENAVLLFALNPQVPFTNHQTERDLRPAKVKQKVSGCFRTKTGATGFACLQAFILTCRQQQRNVLEQLNKLFALQSLDLV